MWEFLSSCFSDYPIIDIYIYVYRPAYAPVSDHEFSEDENDILHEPEDSFVSLFIDLTLFYIICDLYGYYTFNLY